MPVVHLFCNAHLDPVWMWTWEEGLREAISTFRTAVNLLDEFPEFVFNHNESLLYEWVEEYDPSLFERIQHYVNEGRWNITGGWYLQPDVNMPGGETLARVILEGRRYFKEKFGVRPPVAYNFDSFGHPQSLPQLLKQSGFKLYVHCRPNTSQMDLPGPIYRWRGMDGTEMLTIRPDTGWYCTPHPGQAQEQALNGVRVAHETGMDTLVTWGLGDHGGGATREDLMAFRKLIEEYAGSDVEIRHSTPEAFLAAIQPHLDTFPVHEGELQRTLSGTYTSVAPIKRQMREGERLMASAERWSAVAWWRFGRQYPDLREAWKRLMFNTFHDVLCGSLAEDAMPGVDDMYGYTHDVARRAIVKAQQALLPDVAPEPDTIPVYVFNPHASTMRAPVGLNFLIHHAPLPEMKPYTLYDDQGQPVASQKRGGSSIIRDEGTWQPFCGFVADVPPMSTRRYAIRLNDDTVVESPPLRVDASDKTITIESQHWTARFENAALVELSYKGHNLLKAPLELHVMKDEAHAWGGEYNYVYNRPHSPMTALSAAEVGDFVGMEGHEGPAQRVITQGPVWVTVECLVGWQHTRASIRYTFYADLPYIDIDTRLYMQARRKMIKLHMPFAMTGAQAVCEIPYGVTERPTDATEYPFTRWVRLDSSRVSVGVANDGIYGLDVSDDGTLNLSISRGGTHISWSETDVPTDQSYTFMDQEQIDTRFRLIPDSDRVVLDAHELNQPLERFFTYFAPTAPAGAPKEPKPFLTIEPSSVTLGALKQSEDGEALIVRLVESHGADTTAYVTLEGSNSQTIAFSPYEIKSFRISRSGAWTPVNLIEEEL